MEDFVVGVYYWGVGLESRDPNGKEVKCEKCGKILKVSRGNAEKYYCDWRCYNASC